MSTLSAALYLSLMFVLWLSQAVVDLGTSSKGEITEAEGSNIQSEGVFLYKSVSHRTEVVTRSIRQLLLLEIAFQILHSIKVIAA